MAGKGKTRREILGLGGAVLGVGALAAVADAGEAKQHKHPRIVAAINELQEAHRYLKAAPHEFGGHRAKALELIDRTIRQLEICLKF
jgi:predicted metal-dependent hydrolase